MSNQPATIYPFDPYAKEASNVIENELITLSPPAGPGKYHYVVPRYTPFFTKDFRIFHVETGEELFEGRDFHFSHQFEEATLNTQLPVYGSIVFINGALAGNVEIRRYRILGGTWTIDQAKILEILAEKTVNPRTVYWSQIVDLPSQFPVIEHEFPITDTVGWSAVVDEVRGVKEAIVSLSDGGDSGTPPPDGFRDGFAHQYGYPPVYDQQASWSKLCSIMLADKPTSDLVLMVSGAEEINQTSSSLYSVTVGTNTVLGPAPAPEEPQPVESVDVEMTVTSLTTTGAESAFGYRYNDTLEQLEIWISNPLQRGTLTVTVLSSDSEAFFSPTVLYSEPVGMEWVTPFEIGRSPATDSEKLGGYEASEYVRKELMEDMLDSITETLDHLRQDPANPGQAYPPEYFVTRKQWTYALNDFIADIDAMTDYLNGDTVNLPDQITQIPSGPQDAPTGQPSYFISRVEVTMTLDDFKQALRALLDAMEADGQITDVDALLDRIQNTTVINIPFPGGSTETSTGEAAINYVAEEEFNQIAGEIIFVLNTAIAELGS